MDAVWRAVKLGDAVSLASLLVACPTAPLAHDLHGDTPLHIAARNPMGLGVARVLIDAMPTTVCQLNDLNELPVHVAARHGTHDIMAMLLTTSPTLVNETDNFGRTPLHIAAGNGHLGVTHELIRRGARLEARDIYRIAPVQMAYNSFVDASEFGAAYMEPHVSVEGLSEVLRYLLSLKPVAPSRLSCNAWVNTREPLLIAAVKLNHMGLAYALMEMESNIIFSADQLGNTAAHYAVRDGHYDLLVKLDEMGASMAAHNNEGQAPLHIACDCYVKLLRKAATHHYEENSTAAARIFSYLFTRDTHATTEGLLKHMRFSTPPLHAALNMCHINIATLILARDPGAALITDGAGDAAVHLATHSKMVPVLQEMVESHPGIALLTNINGETPLHVAAMFNHSLATRYLAQRNPATCMLLDERGYTPLCTATHHGSIESAEELINIAPAAIHEPDHDGMTPIMYAAEFGHLGVACLIMAVSPEAASVVEADDGWNALHCAVSAKSVPVACCLLEHNPALATVPDDDNRLPLHLLLETYDCNAADDMIAIATALLEAAPDTACTPHPDNADLPLEFAIANRIGYLPSIILENCPSAAFCRTTTGMSMISAALEFSDKHTAQQLMRIPGQDPEEVFRVLHGDELDGHELVPEALRLFAPIPMTCWQYVPDKCDNLLSALPIVVERDSPDGAHARMLVARLGCVERDRLLAVLMTLRRRAGFLPLEIVIKLTCLTFAK